MKFLFNKKIIFISFLILMGLGSKYFFIAQADDQSTQEGSSKAMPVIVSIVQPQAVQIWKEFPARLEAVDYVEIKPQVSGIVTDVKFVDGAEVKKGDVLYIIDTHPYQVEVNRTQAQLTSAYNEADLARKELDRAKNLVEVEAISKRIYDERESSLKIAQSKVDSAKAQLEQAKINLDYANVKSPITGKVSRAEVKKGNLVEAGSNAPLLTSIVSTKGIYADFEIDDQTYLNEVHYLNATDSQDKKVPVKLILKSNDQEYEGFVQSFDNRIDPTSGTIRARAFFANEGKVLLPGMYATIKMGSAAPKQQIVITEKAISTDQNRKFVYVVDDQNKVVYKQIEIGDSTDGKRVVLSGLLAGDKVIVEGIIRIRPDMVVDPKIEGDVPSKKTES